MDKGHKDLYKSKAWRKKNREEKRELVKDTRTQKRQALFCSNRDIDENEARLATPEMTKKTSSRSPRKKTPFAVKFARWKKNREEAKSRAKKDKKPTFIRSVCPGVLPPVKPLEQRAKFKAPAKVKPLQFAQINGNPPRIDTNFNFSTVGPLTRSRAKYVKFVFE